MTDKKRKAKKSKKSTLTQRQAQRQEVHIHLDKPKRRTTRKKAQAPAPAPRISINPMFAFQDMKPPASLNYIPFSNPQELVGMPPMGSQVIQPSQVMRQPTTEQPGMDIDDILKKYQQKFEELANQAEQKAQPEESASKMTPDDAELFKEFKKNLAPEPQQPEPQQTEDIPMTPSEKAKQTKLMMQDPKVKSQYDILLDAWKLKNKKNKASETVKAKLRQEAINKAFNLT